MIEYTIYCDVCGEMIDVQSGSARQARRRAKAKKMLVRVLRKDYCLRCAEKLQNEGVLEIPVRKSSKSFKVANPK